MKLIRTFHPVGQGAFYSERHFLRGGEFTVVYDCGSSTMRTIDLEKKIKSTFPKNNQIDILFISHFHADHINGIEALKQHCVIKKVIIPLLDDEARTLYKVANFVENLNHDIQQIDNQLIDNPEGFFGNETIVIKVRPTEINPNEGLNELSNPIDINTIRSPVVIPSGTVFVPQINVDWVFIPYNYEHKFRLTQFENALLISKLTLKDIDTIENINNHRAAIVNAYKAIDGDLNKNSMILFSGREHDNKFRIFQHSSFNFNRDYPNPRFNEKSQSGCLYMGDIDLNEPSIIDDISGKLKPVLSCIGTIQVPHHGSIHNFESSILKKINCSYGIVSYGTKNNYGHPSDRVLGDIIQNRVAPFHVTENQNSILVQYD
ncbi:MAG: MBL fold metallo-hydrolase [Mariniphaga sp.]